MRSARHQKNPQKLYVQPSDAGGGVSGAGSDEDGSDEAGAAGAAAGAASPFFLPIASITRARYEPGSLSRRTNWVAGALRSPSNWPKITSRDGSVASDCTSSGVSALPSSTPPRSFSLSPIGPNDVKVFARTTGS